MADLASVPHLLELTYAERSRMASSLRNAASNLRMTEKNLEAVRRLDRPHTQSTHQRLEAISQKAREYQLVVKQEAEPIWQCFKSSGMEPLLKLEAQRPKRFRGVGGYELAYFFELTSTEVDAELLYAAVREVQHNPTSDFGDWADRDLFKAANNWAEEHPGQLREQLKRLGFLKATESMKDWVDAQVYREELQDAGQKVAEISQGDVRLMDADDLQALGEYLSCCVGGSEYYHRASAGITAFLCVYSQDSSMPIGLTELFSEQGSVAVGETQSRYERGETLGWSKELRELVQGESGHRMVAEWLGVKPGQDCVREITISAEDYNWWDDDILGSAPFSQTVKFSYSDVADAIAEGEVSYIDVRDNVENYLPSEELECFKEAVLETCEQRDSGMGRLIRDLIKS